MTANEFRYNPDQLQSQFLPQMHGIHGMRQNLNLIGRQLTQIFADGTKGSNLLVSKGSDFFMNSVNLRESAAKAFALGMKP